MLLLLASACTSINEENEEVLNIYYDKPFTQEYHVGFNVGKSDDANDIRAIAVDSLHNIWAATKSGVYVKFRENDNWINAQRYCRQ